MSVYSIVIVDDEVEFGRLIKRVVSSMGHIAEQISSPREFMHRYEKLAPDIIFLDIFMPDFNGMDVARWLVERGFNGKLVFITGCGPAFLDAARAVAWRSKAEIATLEKPARVDQIRDLVNKQRGKP